MHDERHFYIASLTDEWDSRIVQAVGKDAYYEARERGVSFKLDNGRVVKHEPKREKRVRDCVVMRRSDWTDA